MTVVNEELLFLRRFDNILNNLNDLNLINAILSCINWETKNNAINNLQIFNFYIILKYYFTIFEKNFKRCLIEYKK